jgi:hypothetical protein
MFDSVTHYVAYEIFPERFFSIDVNTFDQFGPHLLQVDTSKILLVPTRKLSAEPPPPPPEPNHFKTWRTEPEPFTQIVSVQDQFMQDVLILDQIDFLSNPTRKDSFQIVDEFEHLTWYRAHGRDTLLEVEYSNQFETDTVRIDSVKYLLLPTAKEVPDPFPEESDHYKAYRMQDPVAFDRTVELEDQFDLLHGVTEFIETLKPVYFLTPALKNMPPPMFDSVTHYVAYEIFPEHHYGLLSVQTFDQFGEHALQVDTSKLLLVPTAKLTVTIPCGPPNIGCPADESQHTNGSFTTTTQWTADDGNPTNPAINITSVTVCGALPPGITSAVVNVDAPGLPAKTATGTVTYTVGDHSQSGGPICLQVANNCTPPLTDQCTFNVNLTNNPPVIFQPDTLYGYQVCDTVIHEFAGADPDSDAILDGASLSIEPPCGTYSVARISNPGGSSGRWQVTWDTHGCQDSTTYRIIVDLTDSYGAVSYCTTYCHLDSNTAPVIEQPDFLEGYVDDVVEYDITGTDPDGDAIEDDASIDIQPGCGSWNIVRTSGHGTSSGIWTITWDTYGCTPCDTHMVIHDLSDGCDTSYCTTYVHLSEPESLYWKPPYEDYAPNGMPDIYQKQDGWLKFDTDQWSFCGPCAVANCFMWFDSKYNDPPGAPGDAVDQFPLVRDYTDNLPALWLPTPWDDHSPENVDHTGTPWGPGIGPPPPTPQPFMPGPQPPPVIPDPWGELVERLAWYFDTDGIQSGYCNHTGTNVLQMQQGIQDWFESEMFPDSSTIADTLCMELTRRPNFAYVESLVEKCEDVILLLGFWYEEPEGSGVWYRIGGHYVTVAGVNSETYRIAFSDPFIDAAEFGAPGRIGDGTIIPHSFPHDPTVHNDAGNVSHDIYTVDPTSISPGGDWWLPDYAINGDPGYWSWNFYEQNVPDEFVPFTAPWNGTSPIFTEVEYCIHISPWDYRGDVNVPGGDGVVDIADVVFLLNYLFKGGDPPEPLIEGDTSCDGIVDLSDVIILLNYLFKGGPVPKCCDP